MSAQVELDTTGEYEFMVDRATTVEEREGLPVEFEITVEMVPGPLDPDWKPPTFGDMERHARAHLIGTEHESRPWITSHHYVDRGIDDPRLFVRVSVLS